MANRKIDRARIESGRAEMPKALAFLGAGKIDYVSINDRDGSGDWSVEVPAKALKKLAKVAEDAKALKSQHKQASATASQALETERQAHATTQEALDKAERRVKQLEKKLGITAPAAKKGAAKKAAPEGGSSVGNGRKAETTAATSAATAGAASGGAPVTAKKAAKKVAKKVARKAGAKNAATGGGDSVGNGRNVEAAATPPVAGTDLSSETPAPAKKAAKAAAKKSPGKAARQSQPSAAAQDTAQAAAEAAAGGDTSNANVPGGDDAPAAPDAQQAAEA